MQKRRAEMKADNFFFEVILTKIKASSTFLSDNFYSIRIFLSRNLEREFLKQKKRQCFCYMCLKGEQNRSRSLEGDPKTGQIMEAQKNKYKEPGAREIRGPCTVPRPVRFLGAALARKHYKHKTRLNTATLRQYKSTQHS